MIYMLILKNPANPVKLRSDAIEHTREGDCFSNVLDAAHPRRAPLDSHAKTSVRYAAVAPQVEVPLEGLFWKLVQSDLLFQKLERRRALTTADNFAITFGRQHINSKC